MLLGSWSWRRRECRFLYLGLDESKDVPVAESRFERFTDAFAEQVGGTSGLHLATAVVGRRERPLREVVRAREAADLPRSRHPRQDVVYSLT